MQDFISVYISWHCFMEIRELPMALHVFLHFLTLKECDEYRQLPKVKETMKSLWIYIESITQNKHMHVLKFAEAYGGSAFSQGSVIFYGLTQWRLEGHGFNCQFSY